MCRVAGLHALFWQLVPKKLSPQFPLGFVGAITRREMTRREKKVDQTRIIFFCLDDHALKEAP